VTPCPRCGGALRFQTASRGRHIFKLGAVYSAPLDATYLDEQSVEHRS
jgi:prolyl-tRNA synthetase